MSTDYDYEDSPFYEEYLVIVDLAFRMKDLLNQMEKNNEIFPLAICVEATIHAKTLRNFLDKIGKIYEDHEGEEK